MSKNYKNEKLVLLRNQFKKDFGEGFITDLDNPIKIKRISSGLLKLDEILGGGIPLGKPITVYAEYSCGKTTLATTFAAKFQQAFPNKAIAIFDSESAYEFDRMNELGVIIDNEDRLFYSTETALEKNFDAIDAMVESGEFSLIIIDSIDNITIDKIKNGSIEENDMGLEAKKRKQFFKKIKPKLAQTDTTLLIIAQIYANTTGYGKAKIFGGGNSVRFQSSIIIELAKLEPLEKNKVEVGIVVKAKTQKNQTYKPFETCNLDLFFETTKEWKAGYDEMASMLQACVELAIIKKGGAWYTLPNGEKIQGEERMIALLKQDEKLKKELLNEYIKTYGEK